MIKDLECIIIYYNTSSWSLYCGITVIKPLLDVWIIECSLHIFDRFIHQIISYFFFFLLLYLESFGTVKKVCVCARVSVGVGVRMGAQSLTQKKEQYTDIGFNMSYYIYIYQEQIQGTRFNMGYYIYIYKEQIQGTRFSRIYRYSNPC